MYGNSAVFPLLFVARSDDDRREGNRSVPPYVTSEGLVLVDRRNGADRRRDEERSTMTWWNELPHADHAIEVHEIERIEIELLSL